MTGSASQLGALVLGLLATLLVVAVWQTITAARLRRAAEGAADLATWRQATYDWRAAYWELAATATCPLCGTHLDPEPTAPIAEPNLRSDQ
jgi:hypothetical protein